MSSIRTVCCSNQEVAYFWRFESRGNHVPSTIEKCVELLKDNGYLFNDILEADCEAQIEHVLELAKRGQLRPVEHVKRIGSSPVKDMYEMRWQDIAVIVEDMVTGLRDTASALLRLYYLEEGERWIVGLHVHEKVVNGTEEEIKESQDAEIVKATNIAVKTEAESWGVVELQELRNS